MEKISRALALVSILVYAQSTIAQEYHSSAFKLGESGFAFFGQMMYMNASIEVQPSEQHRQLCFRIRGWAGLQRSISTVWMYPSQERPGKWGVQGSAPDMGEDEFVQGEDLSLSRVQQVLGELAVPPFAKDDPWGDIVSVTCELIGGDEATYTANSFHFHIKPYIYYNDSEFGRRTARKAVKKRVIEFFDSVGGY